VNFVLTARAENYLHGRKDLADTIARLQAYQEAGADVLFAPRVVDPTELRQLLAAVDVPVSVLITPDAPTVGVLAELGVSRISVGGAIAAATYGFAVEAVKELQQQGTASYWDRAGAAREAMVASFVKP
jgi:2-methylisocitrate lyase-like PEP mutase family enzyme